MEKSGFFNSVNGDRRYKVEDFAEYFKSFITNGVFPNPSTNLQVTANNNMTVTLKSGKAWINGYIYINTDDLILSIDPADGALNRIDRIVLRYDTVNREIRAKVKKGTFASSPIAAALQRDADGFELGIADIYISKGAINIVQANITDLRMNADLCGWVNSLIQADTTAIFNQYLDWYQRTTGKYEQDINNTKTQFEQDFNTWLSGIKAALDGDTAGNLLNMINTHLVDYVRQPGYAEATGSSTAYIIGLNPAPTAYIDGMGVIVKINVDSTGASTINVNNLGAKSIKKANGADVVNLKKDGIYSFKYNATTGNFILQGEGGGGTALQEHVLEGRTFTNDEGEKTGTMNNRIFMASDDTLKSVVPIIPNIGRHKALDIWTGGYPAVFLKPPAGYYDGIDTWVGGIEPNLTPQNIKQGVNVFGIAGAVKEGDFKIGDRIYPHQLSAKTMPLSNISVPNVASNYYGNSFCVKGDYFYFYGYDNSIYSPCLIKYNYKTVTKTWYLNDSNYSSDNVPLAVDSLDNTYGVENCADGRWKRVIKRSTGGSIALYLSSDDSISTANVKDIVIDKSDNKYILVVGNPTSSQATLKKYDSNDTLIKSVTLTCSYPQYLFQIKVTEDGQYLLIVGNYDVIKLQTSDLSVIFSKSCPTTMRFSWGRGYNSIDINGDLYSLDAGDRAIYKHSAVDGSIIWKYILNNIASPYAYSLQTFSDGVSYILCKYDDSSLGIAMIDKNGQYKGTCKTASYNSNQRWLILVEDMNMLMHVDNFILQIFYGYQTIDN